MWLRTRQDHEIHNGIFRNMSSFLGFFTVEALEPITSKDGQIIAAKLSIYAGDTEEYYTFVTAEAYNALKEWMDFRISYGERLTGCSWLMRDLWQTTNMNYGARWV
jgi:hypothetical protein